MSAAKWDKRQSESRGLSAAEEFVSLKSNPCSAYPKFLCALTSSLGEERTVLS